MRRTGLLSLLLFLSVSGMGPSQEPAKGDVGEAHEILTHSCMKCHGAKKQKGGLRLDSRAGAIGKGDSGSVAVAPGKAAESELIRRITSKDSTLRMPPGDTPLSDSQVATLRNWIDGGAAWPKDAGTPMPTQRTELTVTDEDRQHWAFRPLAKVSPLDRASIDRFILAKLTANGLTHAAPASREQLIRRVTFRMTGLPPTPEEVDAFVKSGDYAAVVERLLASPHFGERWARHWLDVARYADSDGYESDADRPNAYHYRDFVVRSLNEDQPFDEFVRRQLAGDEFEPDIPAAVAATGFLVAGPSAQLPDRLLEEERIRQRYIELDDMVATIGTAFLGLTLGCARCHDHKFDPVPTRDYYRMLAALHSGDRAQVPLGTRAEVEANQKARDAWEKERTKAESKLKLWLDEQKKPLWQRLTAQKIDSLPIENAEKLVLRGKPDSTEGKALAKKHQKALAISDAEWRAAFDETTRKRWDELAKELAAIKGREPKSLPLALAFRDSNAFPAKTWLFARGDHHDHSTPVDLGFVTVLTHDKTATDYWKVARTKATRTDTTNQRRALADWMTDPDQGAGALLARVIVNRVWQHHFGEGLVRTPNDFGIRGDRPSHPELLEWLAADFVANGWKMKRLHRMILLSDTYRQGLSSDAAKLKADPENRLLSRMRPLRLEVEAIRDAMLAVSDRLNREMYGPAFKPPIPTEAMVARNLKSSYPTNVVEGPTVWRRSVYMFHKRVVPYPLFQAFDAPDAQQCTGRRNVTTVAPQALAVLNDPFVRSRAEDFAKRLLKVGDSEKIVEQAYKLAFGRSPTTAQKIAGVDFLTWQSKERSARNAKASAEMVQMQALTDYCQALFGLNEFIYVD